MKKPAFLRASASLRPKNLLFFLLLTPSLAFSQKPKPEKELTRILFVMDASNSMNAFWGNEPKIDAARKVLLESLGPIEDAPNVEIALRLYGHQTRIEPGKQDCDDTKLEVPFAPHNGDAIRAKMKSVQCLGTTPIARSLEKAAGDFPDNRSRNVIILITDGIEACDEDPCAVSRALQAKGIILKPFVIGIGLEDATKFSLKCVGNYYDAGTPEMFDRVLKIVIDQALNSTTTQLLLLTDDSKPTETDVPVTFYDQRTGEDRYDFVHTMALNGEPDTLNAQPMNTSQLYRTGTYDLEVLTLPRLYIPGVVIKQSGVTPVSIPRSGVLNVVASVAGPGAIFQKDGNELKWVVDLDTRTARDQFKLLPGDYRVIYRPSGAHETAFSIVKDVTVVSGRAVNIEL